MALGNCANFSSNEPDFEWRVRVFGGEESLIECKSRAGEKRQWCPMGKMGSES